MIQCFIITPEQKAAISWKCSDIVSANPIHIHSGEFSGSFAVTTDFLSDAVLRGSPDNEVLREVLESFPIKEVDSECLKNPNIFP